MITFLFLVTIVQTAVTIYALARSYALDVECKQLTEVLEAMGRTRVELANELAEWGSRAGRAEAELARVQEVMRRAERNVQHAS